MIWCMKVQPRDLIWWARGRCLIVVNRELKQTRRRWKRERHLKTWLRFSAVIFQFFKVIILDKCVLIILELNWNQRLGHKKTKLNICHHMLTLSTQLQNRSFHVVERTRTSSKCQKMKCARAKRAKILFFIAKYANLWGQFCCRRRRGCLLENLSNGRFRGDGDRTGRGKLGPTLPSFPAEKNA